MISNSKYNATKEVLSYLRGSEGGSLFFNSVSGNIMESDSPDMKVVTKVPTDHKEFSISIFNTDYYASGDPALQLSNGEVIKLVLFINPKDLTIGQQQVISGNTYTRRGWVNELWGNQQATISATGVSSGFYFFYNNKGGITNKYRRATPGFINLMDIIGLFKNNGWYFLDGIKNPSYFRDGTSRVINVMDSIKIEYDGSTYIGSFNTLTVNDVASNPYRLDYSFDFIVSCFGIDLQGVEGHISKENNHLDNNVHVAIQGTNMDFKTILGLDTDELNKYFPIEEVPDPTIYDYSDSERKIELDYYKTDSGVVKIPEGVFRITRGWRDGEGHQGKCDFRTHTGTIYSATEGTVINVKVSPYFGGSNYVLVKSTFQGKSIYVRYFHVEYGSHAVRTGQSVKIGTVIGSEGTDNGRYPPHCDFEVREIKGTNYNYFDCPRIDATDVLDNMWKVLHAKADTDGAFEKDFKKLIAKHPSEHEITI